VNFSFGRKETAFPLFRSNQYAYKRKNTSTVVEALRRNPQMTYDHVYQPQVNSLDDKPRLRQLFWVGANYISYQGPPGTCFGLSLTSKVVAANNCDFRHWESFIGA